MKRRTRAKSAARLLMILAALLVPTLSLLPLGGLYLYENGYLLIWAGLALVVIIIVYAFERWIFVSTAVVPEVEPDSNTAQSRSYNALEEKAWTDVRLLARSTDIEKLGDIQSVLDLGQKTVETVARRLHPASSDAVWRFTLPEALTITSRVSAELSEFVNQNLPFGDRLTVSQFLQVYRWRYLADVAERAYDIWRVLRLVNPATAVTNEARERLSRALLSWSREKITRRLVEEYVERVGEAAIDLYGGRLRVSDEISTASAAPPIGSDAVGQAYHLRVLLVSRDDRLRSSVRALLRVGLGRAIEGGSNYLFELEEAATLAPVRVREYDMLVFLTPADETGLAEATLGDDVLKLLEADDEATLPPVAIVAIYAFPDTVRYAESVGRDTGSASVPASVVDLSIGTELDMAAIIPLLARMRQLAPSAARVHAVRTRAAMRGRPWTHSIVQAGRAAGSLIGKVGRSIITR